MKYKDTITKIIFTVVFGVIIFVVNESIKNNIIEDDLIAFQKEYKSYINEEDSSKAVRDSDGVELRKYYDNLRTETYKKFKKEMFDCIYDYNFLKNENTSNFQKDDITKYNALIEENDNLINDLKKKYDVKKLEKLENNTSEMQGIALKSLNISILINKEFNKIKNNENTLIKLDDNCFKQQKDSAWNYEKDISKKYCDLLGLSNCGLNNEDEFISYTLNNPKKVSKKLKQYEYVSYDINDLRSDNGLFKTYQNNNNIYVEVFSKEVLGKKIYKYNIISIPKSYNLSCELPS